MKIDLLARKMIGYYWHHNVVCPSVMLCIVVKRYIGLLQKNI